MSGPVEGQIEFRQFEYTEFHPTLCMRRQSKKTQFRQFLGGKWTDWKDFPGGSD